MIPLLAWFTHYILLHRITWLFARTYFFPFLIWRLHLLLNMIIISPCKEHIWRHMRLCLKFFKSKYFALPIYALYQNLIIMLCLKYLLYSYLFLVLLFNLKLSKIQVPFRIIPLNFQFSEVLMTRICWNYSQDLPNEVSLFIIESADISELKNLIFKLKFWIDLFLLGRFAPRGFRLNWSRCCHRLLILQYFFYE